MYIYYKTENVWLFINLTKIWHISFGGLTNFHLFFNFLTKPFTQVLKTLTTKFYLWKTYRHRKTTPLTVYPPSQWSQSNQFWAAQCLPLLLLVRSDVLQQCSEVRQRFTKEFELWVLPQETNIALNTKVPKYCWQSFISGCWVILRLLSHSQALNTKVQKYKNIALSHSQAVETNPSFYYCFISYLCEWEQSFFWFKNLFDFEFCLICMFIFLD